LAFWHHRLGATGYDGNSVIADKDDHARWDVLIRDRYLRSDLAGKDGIGYLLYVSEILDRDRKEARARGAHLWSAVEAHSTSSRQEHADLVRRLDEVNHRLDELNANAVSQNNRFVAQFQRLSERLEEVRRLVFSQTPRERVRSYRRHAAALVQRASSRR
jgi:hypothetical protein